MDAFTSRDSMKFEEMPSSNKTKLGFKEPKLENLIESGSITPISQHFCTSESLISDHDIDPSLLIDGAVERPNDLSVSSLTEMFQKCSFPVTLVDSGNRSNEVDGSKAHGSTWGPGAIGTSIWSGIRLKDVLNHVGICDDDSNPKYIRFYSSEPDIISTSISVTVVMDPAADVLLAVEQNGEPLTPAHGGPLRVIVPGYVSGRSLKALRRIEVAAREADSPYHRTTNRFLPHQIDLEKALADGWCDNPDTAINEFNVNSVISHPAHGQIISLDKMESALPVECRGYAYSGGGRKVVRIELSVDDGQTWRPCSFSYEQGPTEAGKYWCWCLWSCQVPIMEFARSKQVMVRAFDSAWNTQPVSPTPNLLGLMNNSIYSVKIYQDFLDTAELQFEHPGHKKTMGVETEAPTATISPTHRIRHVSLQEVFNNESTTAISAISRSNRSRRLSAPALPLASANPLTPPPLTKTFSSSSFSPPTLRKIGSKGNLRGRPHALNPKKKIPFRLIGKETLSYNTIRLRFALQSPNHVLGLPIGKHMFISAPIENRLCMRSYTPITGNEVDGYFDLIVKVYKPDPNFAEGGKMSQFLDQLSIGQSVDVKGPLGHIEYISNGNFVIHRKPFKVKNVLMLAGGTGITPMFQIMKAIMEDENDETNIYMIDANNSEKDIILYNELQQLSEQNPRQCRIWHTILTPDDPETWCYDTGYVTAEMVRDHFPRPSSQSLVFMCGPSAMIHNACWPSLTKNGFKREMCFTF